MPKIFLSYRREDSEHIAGRLYDRLEGHFERDNVFMDVDSIPVGVDFRKHLDQAVGQCHVVLAVIGERWLEVRYKDGLKEGQRRLDDPGDFVRIEIASALARGIPVVPVLVGRAGMPGDLDLPSDLKELAYRNAAEVRSGRDFHSHVDRLIRGIEELFRASPPQQPPAAEPPLEAPAAPPFKITCPQCGSVLKASGPLPPGARVRCPKCNTVQVLGSTGAPGTPSGPSRAPPPKPAAPAPVPAPKAAPGRAAPAKACALISDIHGNLEALQAVLADVARQGVERVYCLGDVVGYGPNPRECLELVMRHPVVLLGDHDQALLFDPEGFDPIAERAVFWTRARLEDPHPSGQSERLWAFLAERPVSHKEGGLLFVHASPRNPLHEAVLPEDIYNERKMERLFELVERCCFQGHTHIPGIFTEELRRFFSPDEMGDVYQLGAGKVMCNVGSVGQPRDGDWRACYAILQGDLVRFRRVEYDLETTIRKVQAIPELADSLGSRLRDGS